MKVCATLCLKQQVDVTEGVVPVGGIGGGRRALDLLGITPVVYVCIEKDDAARRVTMAAWPSVVMFNDVREMTLADFQEVAKLAPHVKFVLHAAGAPCPSREQPKGLAAAAAPGSAAECSGVQRARRAHMMH